MVAQPARMAVPEKSYPLEWCALLRLGLLAKAPEGQTAAVRRFVAAGSSLAAVVWVAAALAVAVLSAVALAAVALAAAALAVADIANNLSWPTPRLWFTAKLAVVETLAIVALHRVVSGTADNCSP